MQVKGKGVIAMKDLKIGDKVLTSNQYQTVYALGHYNPYQEAKFLKIFTGNTHIEVTPDHLLYMQDKVNPVRASSIQAGDILFPSANVKHVKEVVKTGLYTPLTPDGSKFGM